MMLLLLAALTSAVDDSPCESAIRHECNAALGGSAVACLTCAWEHREPLKAANCEKLTVQLACNATANDMKEAATPFMDVVNTDCATHNNDCGSCLTDSSWGTHECYYCYQDQNCYGVGGSASEEGCDDPVGNYACVSNSDYSGCHCTSPGDDDSVTCSPSQCPPPGSDNMGCEACEYVVGTVLDKPGALVCDTVCDICCEEVPLLGPAVCEAALSASGGCAAINAAIQKAAGIGTPCSICESAGFCTCGTSAGINGTRLPTGGPRTWGTRAWKQLGLQKKKLAAQKLALPQIKTE